MASQFYIHPPLGGIANYTGRQKQPPYTCVRCRNFWPIDCRTGASLTATRSPMGDITTVQNPVNMLGQLNLPSPTAFHAANGVLYRRTGEGAYSAVTSSVGVSTGRAVFAAPFFKKMVIANDTTPLVYDYDTGVETMVELVPTAGFLLSGARLAMNFQSAVWLGGSPIDTLGPHVFTACRQNNVFDWDYGADDASAAYISTGENLGLITEPLSCMYAMTEDQAIIACEEEIWTLSGHPRDGGRFSRSSNKTGILGQNACAMTPRGLFFLSHDGLMLLARNDYGNISVTPISQTKIPSELLEISYSLTDSTVCLAYSSRWNAVWITVRDSAKPQSWAYFLDTGAFVEQPINEYPYVTFPFESLVTRSRCGVWFGSQGHLRQFDTDGTEAINSEIIIGPVQISPNPMDASINTQGSVILGSGTTDDAALVSFHTGPTGECAVNRALTKTAQYQAQYTVGQIRNNNRSIYPQLRGANMTLAISQTASTNRVVFEDYVGQLVRGGNNIDNGQVAPLVTVPSVTIEVDTV